MWLRFGKHPVQIYTVLAILAGINTEPSIKCVLNMLECNLEQAAVECVTAEDSGLRDVYKEEKREMEAGVREPNSFQHPD